MRGNAKKKKISDLSITAMMATIKKCSLGYGAIGTLVHCM